MTRRKDDGDNWFFWLIIALLIFVVVLCYWPDSNSSNEQNEELKRREEEEAKLAKELAQLEKKLEIYERHKSINAFTEKYMDDLCEKRFHQLIQLLLVLVAVVNLCVYFFVPKLTLLDQFTWNGVIFTVLNLVAIFCFRSIKKAKKRIKNEAMTFIEFRVYGNRDKTYFNKKVKFYHEQIKEIKIEIELKTKQLDKINPN